jgi:hypothetical protein
MRACKRTLFFLSVLRGRIVAFKDKEYQLGLRGGKPSPPTLSQRERKTQKKLGALSSLGYRDPETNLR